jgi:molybdopterin-synthase adenylyltransferase
VQRKLQLFRHVAFFPSGLGGFIGVGSQQEHIKNENEWRQLVELALFFLEPNTLNDAVSEFVGVRGWSPELFASLSNFMLAKRFIGPTPDPQTEIDRFSRHLAYYGMWVEDYYATQQRISQSSVTILGCGGIGNLIALQLSTAGVHSITLVDPDIVELSNLSRQLCFTEADIGEPKVTILKEAIQKRNSQTEVNALNTSITSEEDLHHLPASDLIILSADTPSELVFWVNKHCVLVDLAYVNIGYMNDIAVVGPFFIPGETSCLMCGDVTGCAINQGTIEAALKLLNRRRRSASFGPVNAIASAFGTNDALRYLGKFGPPLSANRRIGFHSNSLKLEIQDLPKSGICEVCGRDE